jgi:hypothetical protein
MVPPSHLQSLGHVVGTDFSRTGEIGGGLGKPQRPVVSAPTEPLA